MEAAFNAIIVAFYWQHTPENLRYLVILMLNNAELREELGLSLGLYRVCTVHNVIQLSRNCSTWLRLASDLRWVLPSRKQIRTTRSAYNGLYFMRYVDMWRKSIQLSEAFVESAIFLNKERCNRTVVTTLTTDQWIDIITARRSWIITETSIKMARVKWVAEELKQATKLQK